MSWWRHSRRTFITFSGAVLRRRLGRRAGRTHSVSLIASAATNKSAMQSARGPRPARFLSSVTWPALFLSAVGAAQIIIIIVRCICNAQIQPVASLLYILSPCLILASQPLWLSFIRFRSPILIIFIIIFVSSALPSCLFFYISRVLQRLLLGSKWQVIEWKSFR